MWYTDQGLLAMVLKAVDLLSESKVLVWRVVGMALVLKVLALLGWAFYVGCSEY